MSKIKVMVIDDSKLMRDILTELINSDPGFYVCTTAKDPYDARSKIKEFTPDVLTLDVEMPKMDGITFLKNLMRLNPIPTVMISSLTEKNSAETFEALEIGATDFVTKPKAQNIDGFLEAKEEILSKICAAKSASLKHFSDIKERKVNKTEIPCNNSDYKIVAIGASTGGLEAIREIVEEYPTLGPGIVIAQHIPEGFSRSFAQRLNKLVDLNVKEAENGDIISPGSVYIAPGSSHLEVVKEGSQLCCRIHNKPKVNKHRPSVEVLFDSVANNVGKAAIGVMLTGMGQDGALGMLNMKKSGCYTIAQDEATSVVWGMPGAAVSENAVNEVIPLHGIVGKLNSLFNVGKA